MTKKCIRSIKELKAEQKKPQPILENNFIIECFQVVLYSNIFI